MNTSWIARPIVLATLTGGARCLIGDEIAQRVVERREKIDRTRSLAFAAFGFGWCGAAQYVIYSKFLPFVSSMICRSIGWKAKVKWPVELFLENVGTNVFLYYPVFYFTHACIRSQSVPSPEMVFEKWKSNVVEDAVSCASFWVPANAINFKYVPVLYRASYINFVGVAWLVILSWMRGSDGENKEPARDREDVDPLLRRHTVFVENECECGSQFKMKEEIPKE